MSIFKKGMSENGTIHITMMKNWVSHIKGAYRIPGSAEKGGYSSRIPPPPPRQLLGP